MAAILIKPFPAVAITAVVLMFQALLMAHGGITTWGANTLNMGVVGAFGGYGIFRLLVGVRMPAWIGAAAAGATADLATYAGTALSMALALHGEQSVWTVWLAIFVAFLPTQVPLAILEAIVTVGMLNFVLGRRPDIAARLGLLKQARGEASVAG